MQKKYILQSEDSKFTRFTYNEIKVGAEIKHRCQSDVCDFL